MPIDWPEPFGLVMIEAMACGTPVIAFGRGSVPEIIDDGITGFIVDDVSEAVDAVHRLAQLPRAAIRRRFEERFTADRMAEDYLEIYQNLVNARAMALSQTPTLRGSINHHRPDGFPASARREVRARNTQFPSD